MAVSKYVRTNASSSDLRRYTQDELRRIETTINTLVELLQAVDSPIEIGAADSGGTGYRVLRIPN
jgi:hypothetical protein